MKGKSTFTKEQIEAIKQLINKKVVASKNEQKRIRDEIRDVYGFYFSDFSSKKGYTIEDLDELIQLEKIKVVGRNINPAFNETIPKPSSKQLPQTLDTSTNKTNYTKKNNTTRNWFIAIVVIIGLFWLNSEYSRKNNNTETKINNLSNSQNVEPSSKESKVQPEPKKKTDKVESHLQTTTYKSNLYDHEFTNGDILTYHETTFHTFDFMNMTVTQKSQLDGQWISIKYPIKKYYIEKGIAATTYVLVINSLGVKEIWWSPDVPNLGYDYDDGSRIACYELSVVY